MSRIYGPFRLLNSPYAMGLLGLQAVDEALKVHKAYSDAADIQAVNQSLLKGEPVTELPGGPFRKGLSAITGGLVSPNATVSPEAYTQELLGLREQRRENIKGLEGLTGVRKTLGPGPFGEGGPFATAASEFGAPPGMFSGELPSEAKERETEAAKTPGTPEYKALQQGAAQGEALKKQAQIDVETAPGNVAKTLGLASAKGAATREGAISADLSSAGRALAASNAALAVNKAAEVADAKDAAKQREFLNAPLSMVRADQTHGGIFVNKRDLTIATKGVRGDYVNNDDYEFVPAKHVEGLGGFKEMTTSLKKLQSDVYSTLYDTKTGLPRYDIFPDTSRMNTVAASAKLFEQGTINARRLRQRPELQGLQRANVLALSTLAAAQHRFPNIREIQMTNLLPDSGGISPSDTGGLLGFAHKVPIHEADSWAVANSKYEDMKNTLLAPWEDAAGVNVTGSATAPTADEVDPEILKLIHDAPDPK